MCFVKLQFNISFSKILTTYDVQVNFCTLESLTLSYNRRKQVSSPHVGWRSSTVLTVKVTRHNTNEIRFKLTLIIDNVWGKSRKLMTLLLSEVRVTWTYHKEFNVGEIPESVSVSRPSGSFKNFTFPLPDSYRSLNSVVSMGFNFNKLVENYWTINVFTWRPCCLWWI